MAFARPPWLRLPRLRRRRVVVPVLRLAGVIGSLPLRGGLTRTALAPAIDAAFALERAPVVALVVNSPGGSPVQSSLIAGHIRELAERKQRRVVAFVEDVAASGGYWLALAADEILVDPSSIIGSIGVISAGFGLDRAIERLGVERRVYTTGPHKALLDPFRAESEADIRVLREIQGDIFERFKDEVRRRRGERLRLSAEELFSGRVWSGEKAVAHGLVDGCGELHRTLRQRYGEKVVLRPIGASRSWLQRRLRLGAGHQAGLVPEMLAALEEEALWRRYTV